MQGNPQAEIKLHGKKYFSKNGRKSKSTATDRGVRPTSYRAFAPRTAEGGCPHMSTGYSVTKTILGWKRVPAMRVAMAISSLCPEKTLTWRARESSGRLTERPLRMRAAVASSAVTEGNWGKSWRGGT